MDQTTQQQGNTTENRNLIAEKELLYLKDYLSWELLAMKKCADTASRMEDQDAAKIIREIGQKHQDHYNAILNHLK
jgi:hypothetical protein